MTCTVAVASRCWTGVRRRMSPGFTVYTRAVRALIALGPKLARIVEDGQ